MSSPEIALNEVEKGMTTGFMIIPQNFTENMKNRLLYRNFVSNETLDGIQISVRMDMSG